MFVVSAPSSIVNNSVYLQLGTSTTSNTNSIARMLGSGTGAVSYQVFTGVNPTLSNGKREVLSAGQYSLLDFLQDAAGNCWILQ